MRFLPILTLLVAFFVAGCAAYFSIYGLVLIFSGATIAVISMAVALEIGKLVMTSILFNYNSVLPFLVKLYGLIAVFVLMVITSVGIYGFLSGAYQQSQAPLNLISKKIELIQDEQDRKIQRLKQMDDTIASISSNYVSKRLEEKKQQAGERKDLIVRIDELDAQLLEYNSKKLDTEVHIGPIIKIAEAFGLSRDQAAHYLILTFIVVFDPLAVILTLCFNIMTTHNRKKKYPLVIEEPIIEEPIIEEPIIEEPIIEEPIIEEPIIEEPIIEEPVTEEPVTEEPVTEEPVTEEPVTEEPVTEEPIIEEPIIEEPIIEEPVIDHNVDIAKKFFGDEVNNIQKIFNNSTNKRRQLLSKIQQGQVDSPIPK